jgi:lipid A ethanolaminephosphotransferase
MADHGESLGENGLYLHGLPYFMAPDAQTHIGSILWFGDKMQNDIDTDYIKSNSHKKFTQDNLFHTLLGIFNVKTKVYDKNMDMLSEH